MTTETVSTTQPAFATLYALVEYVTDTQGHTLVEQIGGVV